MNDILVFALILLSPMLLYVYVRVATMAYYASRREYTEFCLRCIAAASNKST